ncbi:protein of unknown function (DUF4604) domain containing protein [Naviculisporaceae sp. PSN 640]
MSQKITAKNLQYNTSLPPFLARLRGQEAESRAHGGPDPMLAGHRRIGKPRSASAEAEDAPLVVDERGEVVNLGDLNKSEEEDENGEKAVDTEEGKKGKEEVAGGNDITKSKKKRKLGKVIGAGDGDEEEEENDKQSNDKKTDKQTLKSEKSTKTEAREGDGKKETSTGNKKKKAKKIKLSFGDEEEG